MNHSHHNTAAEPAHFLTALNGMRFVAILHIFCFHLWVLYDMRKKPGMHNLLRDLQHFPDFLLTYIANGWMSTSFFFVLSGFILAYLYWDKNGQLSISKKTFWLTRAIRIYPIHIIVMLLSILMTTQYQLSLGTSPALLISSGIATVTLTQAWYPAFVPVWSWPTWTISALIFLYAVLPYLLPRLAKLSQRTAVQLLCALPLISLIPTSIYALYFPSGSTPQQSWQIFIGATPIFWLAHFIAGILLTRVFHLSRHHKPLQSTRMLAWGDIALLAIILIACTQQISEPFKFFLRHGLLMPLYLLTIIDLARGNGLAARLFTLPGFRFLGETGFSIFIWQNVVMMVCGGFIMLNPNAGEHQFLGALLGIIILGIISTYWIEKPIARYLRRRWLKPNAKNVNSLSPSSAVSTHE